MVAAPAAARALARSRLVRAADPNGTATFDGLPLHGPAAPQSAWQPVTSPGNASVDPVKSCEVMECPVDVDPDGSFGATVIGAREQGDSAVGLDAPAHLFRSDME